MGISDFSKDNVFCRWSIGKYAILFVKNQYKSPRTTKILGTLSLIVDFSPARTRRAASSSVRCKHLLSYVRLDPERASFSRVSVKVSGEQKQRYACPDFSKSSKSSSVDCTSNSGEALPREAFWHSSGRGRDVQTVAHLSDQRTELE
jgi:hypothetical protein